eukprot:4067-Heterococcus_DN1.PRE.1
MPLTALCFTLQPQLETSDSALQEVQCNKIQRVSSTLSTRMIVLARVARHVLCIRSAIPHCSACRLRAASSARRFSIALYTRNTPQTCSVHNSNRITTAIATAPGKTQALVNHTNECNGSDSSSSRSKSIAATVTAVATTPFRMYCSLHKALDTRNTQSPAMTQLAHRTVPATRYTYTLSYFKSMRTPQPCWLIALSAAQ